MPQYVVLMDHTPQTCPGASKRVREFASETLGSRVPELSAQLGVELRQALHLDPGHQTLLVVEAPSVEAVRDLVFEGGLSQWNDVRVYPTTPVAELMERSGGWPPLHD